MRGQGCREAGLLGLAVASSSQRGEQCIGSFDVELHEFVETLALTATAVTRRLGLSNVKQAALGSLFPLPILPLGLIPSPPPSHPVVPLGHTPPHQQSCHPSASGPN